ncbi:MAG: hypothetical protein NPIRA04_30870 [Nitrospirales bacterium]|nr:MAG: hypothetical protein NPIRA04_30870 [Nitrospirales bacterium]
MSILASILLAGTVGIVCQQPTDLDGHVVRIPDSVQWGTHDPVDCVWGKAPGFLVSPAGKTVDQKSQTEQPITQDSLEPCTSGSEVVRETLYFDFDSAYPLPSELVKLLPLVDASVQTMTVRGFTDRHGPQSLNDRLARHRADAVWTGWQNLGGPSVERQLSGQGLCCYRHDTNDAANRRVEITAIVRTRCPSETIHNTEVASPGSQLPRPNGRSFREQAGLTSGSRN